MREATEHGCNTTNTETLDEIYLSRDITERYQPTLNSAADNQLYAQCKGESKLS